MKRDWREAQRRSFAFGNCNIENPKVTREIVNEEAERLEAQRKPRAESKNAPVTEEHRKIATDLWLAIGGLPASAFLGVPQFLANLQRRWQASDTLRERCESLIRQWRVEPIMHRNCNTDCRERAAVFGRLADALEAALATPGDDLHRPE